MRIPHRFRLSILLIVLILLVPVSALGQADFNLAQLTVAFWPEFDQPEVLVIYRAELPAGVEPPALVELPLPSGIGAPHAVANALETGELVNAEYNLVPAGSGQTVQITAETGTVWMEYYQALSHEGDSRNFSYQWPGTMAVNQFDFEVQQPTGAQSLELEPAAQSQRVGSDGLTYLTGSFESVDLGESVSLAITYEKNTDELTADEGSQLPMGGVSLQAPPGQPESNWQVPALIGLALAAIVAGGYVLWQRSKTNARGNRRRRRSRPEKQKTKQRYCHNCGQQISAQDRFCRNCGAEQDNG